MPEMKLVEQVRVDFEQVQSHGIRQADQLEIARRHEKVVQFESLAAQVLLIAPIRHPVHEIAGIVAELVPVHFGVEDIPGEGRKASSEAPGC